MGDFIRQGSKVWWCNFPEEDPSKNCGFLGWGKGVDLSGAGYKNDQSQNENLLSINTLNASTLETSRKLSSANKNESLNQKDGENSKENLNPNDIQWNGSQSRTSWKSLENSEDRGSSSSPSQGSHKSQDSGFSDSELQHNNFPSSPHDSPDLSKRLECDKVEVNEVKNNTCVSKIQSSQDESNQTVINYEKFQSKEKNSTYQIRDSCSNPPENAKFLETAFDLDLNQSSNPTAATVANESECSVTSSVYSGSSLKLSKRRNLIKTHLLKSKSENYKTTSLNENQTQESFKLSKYVTEKKDRKNSNLIITQLQTRPHDDSNRSSRFGNPGSQMKNDQDQELFKLKSVLNLSSGEMNNQSNSKEQERKIASQLDEKVFRKPKRLNEQIGQFKENSYALDLSDIGGPPIFSSTPKSSKTRTQELSNAEASRPLEKTVLSNSTFAAVRKLKKFSEKKAKKPINLLTSFHKCEKNLEKEEKPSADSGSSVKRWISELRTVYEAEIMTTLQSKSLATDLTRQVTNLAATTSETVRRLHLKTKTISTEFSKLCQNLKNEKYKQVAPLVQSLIGHIKEFIKDYVQNEDLLPQNEMCKKSYEDKDGNIKTSDHLEKSLQNSKTEEDVRKTRKEEEDVLKACEQLRILTIPESYDPKAAEIQVTQLGLKFTEVVDMLLMSHIQALVHVLEEPRTELALRTALSALTSLGLESSHLSHLVARCGGVRALLAICLEARATAVRVSSLRALATVCCLAETIRQFEKCKTKRKGIHTSELFRRKSSFWINDNEVLLIGKNNSAGGVEILSDLLADSTRSEAELSEAAAVLAQITAPWVEDNHSVNELGLFLNSLVGSLTRLVKEFKSSETLLLSAAALANLTFMEPRTVWPLLENQTAGILLSAVRRQGPKVSVFIQEQAATVIANMASVPECRKHLAENRAVVALLCFLQIRHSPLQRVPEITAAERVQQKSAIALSRLCSDPTVARQIIELQGMARLVRLCKEERERNHSDGVLVACLAALRKIVATCGTEAVEELNAMELVESRLLDSFLLYSSRQESYV